jgi:4-diphosphocytidyl-2-C-methyl-D-erythritol kinase
MAVQDETMRDSRSPVMTTRTTMTRTAPAKVNLCLRIVGRRPDGYHLLDSIFAAVDFADLVTISVAPCDGGDERPRVTVSCAYPGVPSDETNLAARAAHAFLTRSKARAHVDVTIEKRIPPGAGLGGGSSNAAAVIDALNTLCDTRVPSARLAELALALGADVPFFLTGGCARVQGVGEHVEPIPGWPGHEIVLTLPPVSVATAWAFRNYRAALDPAPEEPKRLAASSAIAPELLRNDLEAVVLPAFPEVAAAKRGLLAAGAAAAVMSGSGSAVLGVCHPNTSTLAVRDAFAARHPLVPAYVVRIAGPAA